MKTPRVELVYFAGCPHVAAARDALREALAAEELQPEWTEWNCDDEATPGALRRYGSPTVVVDGRDVMPVPSDAKCCRVYPGDAGLRSAPAVEMIRAALKLRNTGREDEE
ncbi:MAG: thioredoxin family protein [Gammaproteobacteria bacterium]